MQVGTSKVISIIPEEHVIKTIDITNTNNVQVPEYDNDNKISISYVTSDKRQNQHETIVDNIFAYAIAFEITEENEDHEPKSVDECRHRNDWPKQKNAIMA